MLCLLCNEKFENNTGGQLTNHIAREHFMSLADYTVRFNLNGVEPKCACGLCDERPFFRRGKFSKLALDHDRFGIVEKLYIKKYGQPLCKNCLEPVTFHRDKPNAFCSFKCSGSFNGGFTQKETQEKINKNIFDKYGVIRPSQLPEIATKISQGLIGKTKGRKLSQERKDQISASSIKLWSNPEFKSKTSASIKKSLNTPEIKKFRSDQMKLRLSEDPVFRQKVFEKSKNRLSKLHLKIRKFLDLDSLGFEPEQVALRYFADELNKANNFIIEINGDYTHANPKIYGPNDIIRLPGQSFLAKEKWEADLIRKNKLEQAGYIVFTIWQSDDWGIKKEELLNLLGTIVESDKLLQNLDVSLNK